MGFLSSPRRRRRLRWVGGVLVAIGLVAAAAALLPSKGRPVRVRTTTNTAPYAREDAAEVAAAARASAQVQPLANRFLSELATHRGLERAYAALAPGEKERYSRLDWESGRDLPLTGVQGTSGASVVFSGRATVGLVASFTPDVLFAVRYDRLTSGWRVAYMHQGQSSRYVTVANYAPAGFAPGSHHETLGTWLILFGGLAALIAAVAVIDRRLSR